MGLGEKETGKKFREGEQSEKLSETQYSDT